MCVGDVGKTSYCLLVLKALKMNWLANSIIHVSRSIRINATFRRYSSSRTNTPAGYCLELVRQYDYENFLCTLLLTIENRSSAFAVRAFNIEISRVQDQVSDPRIGQVRMRFWEDAVEKIFTNDPPKHPVCLELYRASKRHKLSKRYLKRLITSRSEQLTSSTFPDLQSVELYSEQSVSSVYYLLLEASGIENVHADHVASHVGKAHGITNLLRSVPYHAQRKVIILPQDVLVQHNVAQESILRGKGDRNVRDVVFEVASLAKQHLDKARSLSKSLPTPARGLFLPALTVDSYLERLRLTDFDVFNGSLQKRKNSLPLLLLWNKVMSRF